MSTIFDNDILVHYIAAPGLPGDGFTAPEAATMRGDLDDLLSRPIIDNLTDIPDVSGTPASGDTIVYTSGTGWETAPIQSGLTQVLDHSGVEVATNVTRLYVWKGITAEPHPSGTPGWAYLSARFAGTGSESTAARSDHTHPFFTDREFEFPASGTLSGGTRTLVSSTITGLDPAKTYVIKGKLFLHLRGDGTGASFARPRLTISGVAKDIFEDSRIVAGVLITEVVIHPGLTNGGVSSMPVSATVAFQPGDPVYVGGGVLVIEIQANR